MKIFEIKGANFRPPARAIIDSLPIGTALELRPEPDNPVDANAIGIWLESESLPPSAHIELANRLQAYGETLEGFLSRSAWHLGYIAAPSAAILAPALDNSPAPARFGFTLSGNPAALYGDYP